MTYPFEINIRKFKSIQEGCQIPFSNKTTLLIGQNNSGKTNILRSVAAIFNKYTDNTKDDFEFSFTLTKNIECEKTPDRIIDLMISEKYEIIVGKNGEIKSKSPLDEIRNFALSHYFQNTFRFNSNLDDHLRAIHLDVFRAVEKHFNGTVYIPTTRYITRRGSEPELFTRAEIAGDTLTYGKIIDQLSEIDRPPTPLRETYRKQKEELESFVGFFLEKKNFSLEVPRDQTTVHVTIDNNERPIEQLGTGVEQLIIIGLASFTFPGKLVLIDEPELHFHPRAQKRMIQYLNENVGANFVIATHSASILDAVNADVLQVTYDGEMSKVRTVANSQERYRAVRDLGHSPSELLQTRFALWVEGPSDRVYLNHWIKKIDSELMEGIDYTILFYGGKILSHHSFLDGESELVKAVSLARAFAVVMDSDRKPDKPNINQTKARVRDEIEKQGGLCWITEGREIENYIPITIIEALSTQDGVNPPKTKRDQILDPEKVKKHDFARQVIAIENHEWPLDLKERVTELVEAIRAAR